MNVFGYFMLLLYFVFVIALGVKWRKMRHRDTPLNDKVNIPDPASYKNPRKCG